MKKDQILGILRHILTFGGGLLVAQGTVEEGIATEVTGAVITLIGAVWSALEKIRR